MFKIGSLFAEIRFGQCGDGRYLPQAEGAEGFAAGILRAVGRRGWDNDDKNSCTVHSAVYNLTQKTVLWVTNENYDDPNAVFTFSLAR